MAYYILLVIAPLRNQQRKTWLMMCTAGSYTGPKTERAATVELALLSRTWTAPESARCMETSFDRLGSASSSDLRKIGMTSPTNYPLLVYSVMPNTHRLRRRDETVLSRRRRRCEHNSQLAHDDCRRILLTVWKLVKQTP